MNRPELQPDAVPTQTILTVCIAAMISLAVAMALLVGGTFTAITMVAIQEARARAEQNATAILAAMTAGFAFGQLMGPVASVLLGWVTADYSAALSCALLIAASGLIASAIYLRYEVRRHTNLEAHCHG